LPTGLFVKGGQQQRQRVVHYGPMGKVLDDLGGIRTGGREMRRRSRLTARMGPAY
jgi:hypothetical protein